mmetsp:Transcript_35866/g.77474  ORF Transcript_35866/g.77474 Transcript_35866/m.77474 type:complete len:327 (-) Transcript_35866:224-1204(-)
MSFIRSQQVGADLGVFLASFFILQIAELFEPFGFQLLLPLGFFHLSLPGFLGRSHSSDGRQPSPSERKGFPPFPDSCSSFGHANLQLILCLDELLELLLVEQLFAEIFEERSCAKTATPKLLDHQSTFVALFLIRFQHLLTQHSREVGSPCGHLQLRQLHLQRSLVAEAQALRIRQHPRELPQVAAIAAIAEAAEKGAPVVAASHVFVLLVPVFGGALKPQVLGKTQQLATAQPAISVDVSPNEELLDQVVAWQLFWSWNTEVRQHRGQLHVVAVSVTVFISQQLCKLTATCTKGCIPVVGPAKNGVLFVPLCFTTFEPQQPSHSQ